MPNPPTLKPDPDYRPNPGRAIFVQGTIDQDLIDRVTPLLLRMQASSREPITVYIDSPGGSTYHFDVLVRLLRARNQDFDPPCRIITCTTNLAASAAADLLVWGDYATAAEGSTVYFHGIRTNLAQPLTAEDAFDFTESLRTSNTQYAINLAEQCKIRFFERLTSLWWQRADASPGPPETRNLDWLVEELKARLSTTAQSVLDRSEIRRSRSLQLTETVLESKGFLGQLQDVSSLTNAEFEAAVLKELIAIELRANRETEGWGFSKAGIHQLRDDFLLIVEYIGHHSTEPLAPVAEVFGDLLLTEEQLAALRATDPAGQEKHRREMLLPLLLHPWLFLLAICQTLQSGENQLTAKDAFWLGLIDEVIGDVDYAPFRLFVEYQPGTGSETP